MLRWRRDFENKGVNSDLPRPVYGWVEASDLTEMLVMDGDYTIGYYHHTPLLIVRPDGEKAAAYRVEAGFTCQARGFTWRVEKAPTECYTFEGTGAMARAVETVDSVIRDAVDVLRNAEVWLNREKVFILSTSEGRYGVHIPGVGHFYYRDSQHMADLENFHMPAPWYRGLTLRLRDEEGEFEMNVDSIADTVRVMIVDNCPRDAEGIVDDLRGAVAV